MDIRNMILHALTDYFRSGGEQELWEADKADRERARETAEKLLAQFERELSERKPDGHEAGIG